VTTIVPRDVLSKPGSLKPLSYVVSMCPLAGCVSVRPVTSSLTPQTGHSVSPCEKYDWAQETQNACGHFLDAAPLYWGPPATHAVHASPLLPGWSLQPVDSWSSMAATDDVPH